MPKRTRAQQDQHNHRRRIVKQEGRKAIFCIQYMLKKYPAMQNKYEEASEFYTLINSRYPRKRDLSKAHEFLHMETTTTTTTTAMLEPQLEPQLEIHLMPPSTVQVHAAPTTTVQEEIPPVSIDDFESNEIEKIIAELRQDSDLASIFDNIELPVSPEELCDIDLQDFNALGADLPELPGDIMW